MFVIAFVGVFVTVFADPVLIIVAIFSDDYVIVLYNH